MKNLIVGVIVSALSFSVFANTESPYVGQESRKIKALSQQEIEGYLNGKGLEFAKAAELNQFPGPSHVLKVAKELNLTEEQTRRTQEIFDSMKSKATMLGNQFVEKERELDRQFSSGAINANSLKILLSDIGALQANIRHVHLNAHLDQKALLTKHQIYMYDQLRGYSTPDNNGTKHHH
ncbi:hypothetical protein [Marinomonas primoryensis]|jgi:Spy/CpxP family protein refolding chaperone|uniref:hypothetical protein n=1 Tax=Marinomonas primoryensis TaxID=178399 RepID=UPI0030D891B4|tara:strand:- start:199 stop:735 length:537 start_codon:yes stop_codon:yes gene_type:complete